MPIQSLKCVSCGYEFEAMKKLEAAENPSCEKCGSSTEIQFKSFPVVHLKGWGFHKNDYDHYGPWEYTKEPPRKRRSDKWNRNK